MTPAHSFLICSLAITVSGAALAQNEIITFDDLTPGSLPGSDNVWEGPIPNGYGGLQWSNFWVVDTTLRPPPNGYQNADVSPNNVAFNGYGNPATLDNSGGLFDLNSAYLTAAWNDGLQVMVTGYANGNPIYNNTYVVNTTGPLFVNFNYLDVDVVSFSSSGGIMHPGYPGPGTQFAMDNLSITLVPEPSAFVLLGLTALLMAVPRWQASRQ